ncbi:hypothetical protein Gotri_011732 [Gossypium trilobum]|uniref:Uncharacterized protein n=1 Tax=Gossypium trilobum TaxID=34281 RepID=A0A7J9EVQ0_9ROSI|nr:hypothetical protein [Gossypium trilobum]
MMLVGLNGLFFGPLTVRWLLRSFRPKTMLFGRI